MHPTNCVKAMRDAVAINVTVKRRIGIDKVENCAAWATSAAPSPTQAATLSSSTPATPS
jgi:tRNA-dihydrouridine synthase